jgi:hypothetical protein
MSRWVKLLVHIFVLTLPLSIMYLLHIASPSEIQEHEFSFLFSAMLLALLFLSYTKRRKRVRIVLSLFLGLLSCYCWLSSEHKFIAMSFLGLSFWVLVAKFSKEKRRQFSEAVRREAIHKQNGNCNRCKRKLVAYGMDVDHKNGDRSNNKLSNCQVLCVACHRKKHAQ